MRPRRGHIGTAVGEPREHLHDRDEENELSAAICCGLPCRYAVAITAQCEYGTQFLLIGRRLLPALCFLQQRYQAPRTQYMPAGAQLVDHHRILMAGMKRANNTQASESGAGPRKRKRRSASKAKKKKAPRDAAPAAVTRGLGSSCFFTCFFTETNE